MLFWAFVNDTGRPWSSQVLQVSKKESKSRVVFFSPLFLVSTTEELCFFFDLGSTKMSKDSVSHGQVFLRSVIRPSALRTLLVHGERKSPISDSPA